MVNLPPQPFLAARMLTARREDEQRCSLFSQFRTSGALGRQHETCSPTAPPSAPAPPGPPGLLRPPLPLERGLQSREPRTSPRGVRCVVGEIGRPLEGGYCLLFAPQAREHPRHALEGVGVAQVARQYHLVMLQRLLVVALVFPHRR